MRGHQSSWPFIAAGRNSCAGKSETVNSLSTVDVRPSLSVAVNALPPGYNRGTHAQLMIDLVVMAFQCDITRVVSFMLDDARSDFVYNFIKVRNFTNTGSTPGTAPGNPPAPSRPPASRTIDPPPSTTG